LSGACERARMTRRRAMTDDDEHYAYVVALR
jgi:hypothetical protein